ncbi:unnamed protein product, partial [Adineta steineri]
YRAAAVYSIQCCTGDDNTCSSKPVDCPSNICFKLVINKVTEERGCLDDLIKLLNFANKDSRTFNNENGLTSGSSNDQCHKLGAHANSISVSKSVWSYIVQIWSSTNGLRLFINDNLVASRVSQATNYTGSAVSNLITLANGLNSVTTCNASQVGSYTPYVDDMDEFQVYSRELSADDNYTLYTK